PDGVVVNASRRLRGAAVARETSLISVGPVPDGSGARDRLGRRAHRAVAARRARPLARAVELRARLDAQRLRGDDVTLDLGRPGQVDDPGIDGALEGALDRNSVGANLALDRARFAERQGVTIDIALDHALDVERVVAAQIADDLEIRGNDRGAVLIRPGDPAGRGLARHGRLGRSLFAVLRHAVLYLSTWSLKGRVHRPFVHSTRIG